MINVLLPLLFAYLIGSIPFGLLIGRLAGLGDIRKTGSGNIGATNMLRAGGKTLALLTLLLDAGKGIAAIYTAYYVSGNNFNSAHWAMLAAMIGHCFPLWLRFKGGKGIATAIGVLVTYYYLIVGPILAFAIISPLAILWLFTLLLTRTVSLASLIAALALPLLAGAVTGISMVEPAMAGLIIFQHRANIRRLLKGEEHRMSFRRKGS